MLFSEKNLIVVRRKYNSGANAVFTLGASTQMITSLIIILSWFDVLVNVTNIFPQEEFWNKS